MIAYFLSRIHMGEAPRGADDEMPDAQLFFAQVENNWFDEMLHFIKTSSCPAAPT